MAVRVKRSRAKTQAHISPEPILMIEMQRGFNEGRVVLAGKPEQGKNPLLYE